MILRNDFYSILQQETSVGSMTAKITIDKNHKILKGHFPGLPIVPGVCMMQMIMEMTEVCTRSGVRLVAAHSIKFLSVINPDQHQEISVAIQYVEEAGHLLVRASLFCGSLTFFKMNASLKIV
jgi:3-hydroxyacyl-[acyl-carrier-protein] dehydratase